LGLLFPTYGKKFSKPPTSHAFCLQATAYGDTQGLPQKASKIAHQSEEHPETTPYGLRICQRSSNIQHETRVSDDSLQS
jgi:hypothetical protein